MPYKYVWVSDAAGECATLLFYVMTGLYFRPHAENPYFALQDDEISMAVRTVILTFSLFSLCAPHRACGSSMSARG